MLYIVATPIGNLEDITLRGLRILREVDVILSEDTRHTGLLLKHYDIAPKQLVSFYDEVEWQKIPEILALLLQGKNIALVSDAGTPLVSDPGFKLVREAVKNNIKVESLPGPSAVLAALTVSGLPTDKFLFLGYPPEKKSHQLELYLALTQYLSTIKSTVIFFLSPYKLLRDMESLEEVVGDRDIVIARELTKVHEEVWRGKISEARHHFREPKGEFVLLFNWSDFDH